MKLIIARHGETIENQNHICQGQTPGTLTPEGINQAKKLALKFKNEKIDAIYSSDLKRTVDTSNEILKYHPELKLNLDKRLRERFLDIYEGKPWPENWDWENLPGNVESNQELYNRAKEFLDEIYKKHKNETILVITHGGFKRALLLITHNKSYDEFEIWEDIKNTAVSEFTINEDGKHKVHILNNTEHLK